MGIDRYVFRDYYIGGTGCLDFQSFMPTIEDVLMADSIAIQSGIKIADLDFVQYAGLLDNDGNRTIQIIYIYTNERSDKYMSTIRCDLVAGLGYFYEMHVRNRYVDIDAMELRSLSDLCR